MCLTLLLTTRGADAPQDGSEDYRTGVANGVSSIAISATPNHSGAMVTIFSAAVVKPPRLLLMMDWDCGCGRDG